MKGENYMTEYEKPQLIDGEEEDICVDVHSSGIGLVIVGSIVVSLLLPPTPVY